MVIDNSEGRAATEFSEIAVERRLDRSGDGGYRLNGARCRLVDVIEVLSDTNLGREMHSVISQGRVEAIVHSKPRERRLLVEEAAGLGKHRKRRRRAELKLRARARQPRPRARRRARGAGAAAAAEAPGAGGRAGARIEREELGLRAQLVSEELRFGADRAAAAEEAAEKARAVREKLEEAARRGLQAALAPAEERFAARDRERTQAWGLLTKLRGDQERVARARRQPLRPRGRAGGAAWSLRAELGPLTLDVGPGGARRTGAETGRGAGRDRGRAADRRRGSAGRPLSRRRRDGARDGAGRGPRAAPSAPPATPDGPRACSASATARRCGRGWPPARRCSTTSRGAEAAEAAGAAIRARVERIERKVVGGEDDGDEIAEELRACSQREFELQAQMKETSDELTRAEVEAPHLGDRRAEAERELASIAERLGEEIAPAEAALGEEERAEIDSRLERLERRRRRSAPSTRWPSRSTTRRASTSRRCRRSARTSSARCASWRR